MTEATVQTRSLLKYGSIALPLAFAGLPLYIHAPDLYTRHFGLGIGLIGIILLGVRLFDAIQDPIIGFLSDKFAQHRLAIVYIGAMLMGTGMLGLFSFPAEQSFTAVWFAINIILATTGFSILSINLNMIGGFWVNNQTQRTRITATREALSLLGLLLAAAFPSIATQFVSDQTAYSQLAVTFTVLLVIGMWLFHSFLSEFNTDHPLKRGYGNTKWSFLTILIGQQKTYFITCFLSYLAAATPAVLVLFFIRDYLQAEAWTPVFLIAYFLSGSAFMPVWYQISKKVGKQQAWLISMVLAIVTFVWVFTLEPHDFFPMP
jgi:Na+/melibiose symporter-like transporter